MLGLNIVRSLCAVRLPPQGADTEVEAWHSADGHLYAYGYALKDQHWIDVPDIATFHFTTQGSHVTAFLRPLASEHLAGEVFRREVLPVALQVAGFEAVHASAVQTSRGVVGFCGVSGAGKSTVAYGLSLRGFAPFCDDALVLDGFRRALRAIPVSFEIRLRPDSASFFEQVSEAASKNPVHAAPLAALCVLKHRASREEIRPLRSAQALPEILSHAYCFNLRDLVRKRRMMEHYLEVVARVPMFEIRLRAGLDRLPGILDRIERIVLS